MSYLRPAARPVRRPRSAGSAMGDDVTVPYTSGPAILAAQVNRFGVDAPAAYQFVTDPLPIDAVKVSPALALVAISIYQRRATDAYQQFHDQGSLAALEAANRGFADPVAFVTGHLADVTSAVRGFADSVGLPPAAGDPAIGLSLGGLPSWAAMAGVAAGLLYLWKGR